jgi:hypothetical protein
MRFYWHFPIEPDMTTGEGLAHPEASVTSSMRLKRAVLGRELLDDVLAGATTTQRDVDGD